MENILHPEITLEILSRLPVDSVLRCARVCKTWRALLLNNNYFADMHHHRQLQLLQLDDDDQEYHHLLNNNSINYGAALAAKVGLGLLFWIGRIREEPGKLRLHYGEFYDETNIDDEEEQEHEQQHDQYSSFYKKFFTRIDYPPINKQQHRNAIIGSCNGLICFSVRHHDIDDPVFIFNPITREYIELPKYRQQLFQDCMVSGFGYHSSTNQYKVVRITYHPFDQGPDIGFVQVYTLGDGRGWRNTGQIAYSLLLSPGIPINGALHWLDSQGKILSFHLANEEFRLLPSPPCVRPGHACRFYKLRNFGRCLCIVDRDEQGESVDIWSLKKNSSYDMKDQNYYHSWSWTRELSIALKDLDVDDNQYEPIEPLALTKSREIILRQNLKILSVYDPKTASLKKLLDVDMGLKFFGAVPHMSSFVSLKALGENSKRIRRSRRIMQR
ncbi:F-box domain [Macleaya cordata]|uniref:F-box domain n=1 Tax=Macleaya cordata TaxID=56857 RepID=A0A200RB96_MACCD|nr:F-box domain [Macleaya cordata]